jgi:diguanylate cyclase (GGDEF)-like protein
VEARPHEADLYPPRLRWFIRAIVGVTAPLIAGAAVGVALEPPEWRLGLEISLFFAFALLAELRPVPIDEHGETTLSLAFVFVLATLLLFGWQYGVLSGTLSVLIPQLSERRPIGRTLFNVGAHALSAFAAAAPLLLMHLHGGGMDFARLMIATFLGGGMFVAVNLLTVCTAMSLHEGVPLTVPLRQSVRYVGPALPIMASLAALAAGLWRFQPQLIALLAGPLFAVTLYQRSSVTSRLATRDAHTDSLTLLGNHRAFVLELRASVERALATGGDVSLCLIDVDQFKDVNDTFGHPAGDEILIELGRQLTTAGGRAFRLGGDEFALLIPDDERGACRAVEALHRRIARTSFSHGEGVSVSVGIGSCPHHARTAKELDHVADAALYWAKANGKDRTCVYSPSIVRIYSPAELGARAERVARLRAAENLVRVVDAKDTYTGTHSESVARLVEQLARRLGLEEETVAQLRLAGLLHDLGKIAISDQILQKPGRLTFEELRLLRMHPELGASLLDGLDLSPVDAWIRHHHEHWDGSGYPLGLAGTEIPLGSRIILAADAFDAIVSERSYRPAASAEAALAELRRMAGIQFDPDVVDALQTYLESQALVRLAECELVVTGA